MAIGVVVRPRGNRGELAVEPLTQRLERFALLKEVFLFGAGGPLNDGRPYEVEGEWLHRGRVIIKLRGVDSISEAEQLRGAEMRLPFAERLPAEPDEYYHSDLIGCEVVNSGTDRPLGQVTGMQEGGGYGLLVVGGLGDSEEILIPFVRAICVEIDVAVRRIVVKLPEGLTDLNRR